MSSFIRFQPEEWMMYHATSRCIEGKAFLKPIPKVNELFLGILGKTMECYKEVVCVHNVVVMSNHYHLMASVRDGKDLADFMRMLNGEVARELNRVWTRKGPFWDGRYNPLLLLDDEAVVNTWKYVFANSFKERLVEHPSEWPGFHGFQFWGEGRVWEGVKYDRTEFGEKSRLKSGRDLTLDDFKTVYPIKLVRPHMWKGLSHDQFRSMMCEMMDDVLVEWGAEEEVAFLGVEMVLDQDVEETRVPKAGRRSLCRAGCIKLVIEFKRAYKVFKAMYQEALFQWTLAVSEGRSTEGIKFPPGGILPGRMVPT